MIRLHIRRRLTLTALVVVTAGCAGGQLKPIPTTVPPIVGSTIEGVKVEALTRLKDLSVVVRNTVKLYNNVSKGLVPANADAEIRQAFVAFADESDGAGGRIVHAVSSEQISTALEPLFKAGNNLTAVINRLLASQRTGGWFEMLGTALEILAGLPAKPPQPVLATGGVR